MSFLVEPGAVLTTPAQLLLAQFGGLYCRMVRAVLINPRAAGQSRLWREDGAQTPGWLGVRENAALLDLFCCRGAEGGGGSSLLVPAMPGGVCGAGLGPSVRGMELDVVQGGICGQGQPPLSGGQQEVSRGANASLWLFLHLG